MNTRPLTADERSRLDFAWDTYLDSAEHARDVTSLSSISRAIDEVTAAWDVYVDYRQDQGIISTLAGYRKCLVSA